MRGLVRGTLSTGPLPLRSPVGAELLGLGLSWGCPEVALARLGSYNLNLFDSKILETHLNPELSDRRVLNH